jgi:Fe-S-cluster containining protein
MLLESKYNRTEIKKIINESRKHSKHVSGLDKDIKKFHQIIYENLKLKYPYMNEKELWEVIHFKLNGWSIEDLKIAMTKNFCNKCGFCCRTCSPLDLANEDVGRILMDDISNMDNIESKSNGYKFKQDKPCKYINPNGNCDIYKIRPISCRDYPFSVRGFHISPHCNNAVEIGVYFINKLIEECLELSK